MADRGRDPGGSPVAPRRDSNRGPGWFGGGHYRDEAKFNLPAEPGRAEHSAITELSFDGERLLVRLTRDVEGRRYDRGTKHQELELRFAGDGKLASFAVRNRSWSWWPFGGWKLSATIPGEGIRTADPVFLIDPAEPHNGTTLYSHE